ncbi:MAG: hypothetical protein ABI606_09475 [Rhodoferax sp.]
MKQRILALLIALDVFLFACLCLGNVRRNETASSAAWSLEQDGKLLGRIFRPLIDWLFHLVQKDHCAASWRNERKL